MNSKNAALAFRIWQYASAREWDVLASEVGEALGEPTRRVAAVCRGKGWNERMRGTQDDWNAGTNNGSAGFSRDLAREIVAGRVGVD